MAKNPDVAFPALLRSYRYDPKPLVQAYLQNHGINPNILNNPNAVPQARLTPEQQNNQRLAAIEQWQRQQQQEVARQQQEAAQRRQAEAQRQQAEIAAHTTEMLTLWAADKPHFERVRRFMGQVLSPDPTTGQSAIVPLTAEGKVDLDTAYELGVNAIVVPEERQRQQAFAAKAAAARRASGSIRSNSPGSDGPRRLNGGQPGSSGVRNAIKDAIAEISSR